MESENDGSYKKPKQFVIYALEDIDSMAELKLTVLCLLAVTAATDADQNTSTGKTYASSYHF